MTNTWDGGKSDDQDILRAIEVLVECGIDRESIHKEEWIASMWSNTMFPPYDLFKDDVPNDGWDWIHHPDIYVLKPDAHRSDMPVWFIVEIDGSYHDSVAGRKKTDRRNKDYKDAGLECIAISKSEYPNEGEWDDALKRQVKRLMSRT